jgi:predicted permease
MTDTNFAMETVLHDLRYGFRTLLKSPGFTAVAVLTLALGIGANTAIFSLINAVLLKMLPVHNPTELVVVGDPGVANNRSIGTPRLDIFSYPLYKELRDGNHVFSGLFASGNDHRVKVETDRSGEITSTATGTLVSGNYFSVLGLNASMGRTLTPDDDRVVGGQPVTVLSYRFWKEKLSGDPGILGQTLRLNGEPFTIVGVGPKGFIGDTVGDAQDLWIPMTMQSRFIRGRSWLEAYDVSWLRVIGRLKPGENLARARADLNVLLQQILNGPVKSKIRSADMQNLRNSHIEVAAGGTGFSDLRNDFRGPLYLLMAMVGLVLLIACVNVANLLLARAMARKKEIAVRLSIGASRGRLVRQLLTESLLLALAGGACGLLAAGWAKQMLLRVSLGAVGQDKLDASLDLRVLAFTAGVTLLTGILFGLIPALRSLKFAVVPALKESSVTQSGAPGRSSGWNWDNLLVIAQVSLSVLVLFAAGLLVRSLHNLQSVDLGYKREHLLLLRTDPVAAGYGGPKLMQFYDEVSRRLANLPGVRGVTASHNGLFSGSESDTDINVEGYAPPRDEDRSVYQDVIGPNYFTTLGVPMLMGRDIGLQDTAASPKVAVINEAMAHFYFGNSNPIGKKISEYGQEVKSPPLEIVGVAANLQDHDVHKEVQRRYYYPLSQTSDLPANLNFEIRTLGDPGAFIEAARKQISSFDSRVPVTRVRTLDELIDSSISDEIAIAKLSTVFGLLALLLACIGLYGVVSYAVSGRTREIGVRMALGANRQNVLWLVLREALKLAAVGVVIGIPAALAASRLIQSMLFHLTTLDPYSMLIVILLLGAVATIAGFIPAQRATKVNPVIALRYE